MNQWFGHLLLSSMGLAAAGVLVLVIRAVLRRDPVACYRMLVILLFAALTLPVLQLTIQGRAVGTRPAIERFLARVWFTESPEIAMAEPVTLPALEDADAPVWPEDANLPPPHEAPLFGPRAEGDGFPIHAVEVADIDVPESSTESEVVVPRPADLRGRDWSRWPLAPWLAVVWLTGVIVAARRQLRRLAGTYALVRRSRPVESDAVNELWRSVAGPRSRVRLRVSDEISSPATWGLLRPALLLPTRDVENLKEDVLEWALRHELVHIRRGDARTATIQGALTTLFWFHPVAWWLSSLLDGLRELSCDHLVVRGHGRRRSYALALLDYACGANAPTNESPAPAHGLLVPWSGSASQLKRRIKMLEKTRNVGGARDRLVTWTSMIAMLATLWGGQLAIAATLIPAPQEEPNEPPTAPCLCDRKTETAPEEDVAEATGSLFTALTLPEKMPAFPAFATSTFEVAAPEEVFPATAGGQFAFAFPEPVSGPFDSGLAVAGTATCDRRIGLKLKRVGEALASHLDVNPAKTLLIDAVAKGSPAEHAGLERHDVLVGINGRHGITVESLREAVKRTALGHALQLAVVRGFRDHDLQVEVTNWQAEGFWAQPFKPGPDHVPAPSARVKRAPKVPQQALRARRLRAAEAPKPRKVPFLKDLPLKKAPLARRFPDAERAEVEETLRSFERSRRKIEQEIRKVERELRALQGNERRRGRISERRAAPRRRARGSDAPLSHAGGLARKAEALAAETVNVAEAAKKLATAEHLQAVQASERRLKQRKTSLESALKLLAREVESSEVETAITEKPARGTMRLN